MLGPAGRGMGHSWGRGASGGMSTSITTESSNVGSGGGRSNRYQLLEDDSGTHGNIPDKAPFGGRSSLINHLDFTVLIFASPDMPTYYSSYTFAI